MLLRISSTLILSCTHTYLVKQQEIHIGIFEDRFQRGQVWLEQKQSCPESIVLLIVLVVLEADQCTALAVSDTILTLNRYLYKPTTLGSKVSGLDCCVSGLCSILCMQHFEVHVERSSLQWREGV